MSSLLLYTGLVTALAAAALCVKTFGLIPRRWALTALLMSLAVVAGAWWWPPPATRAARGRRAIDAVLPRYQFAERHRTKICAPPEQIAAALRAVTPGEIRGLALLGAMRGLRAVGEADEGKPFLEMALESNFVTLADTTGELVLGSAGEFWRRQPLPDGHPLPAALQAMRMQPGAFAAFEPGGGAPKAVVNFVIEPADFGCQAVITETRIHAADPAMQRRFAAYWRLIQPGSALLRRSWLEAVRARAEGGARR